jgi:predicted nucleic acid-binding protein
LKVYADSSFLVSHYLLDTHSQESDRRMQSRPSLLLTPFLRVEIADAIYQYVFRKAISPVDARRVWEGFQLDCRNSLWDMVEFPPQAWEATIVLASRYGPTLGVRTLDSLHVACALELKADRFWTFDERQARLAQAVGLDTNA